MRIVMGNQLTFMKFFQDRKVPNWLTPTYQIFFVFAAIAIAKSKIIHKSHTKEDFDDGLGRNNEF
jgi:hypothetical protein